MAEEYSEEESDEEIREVFGLIEEMKTFVEYDVRDQYTQRVFLEEADEELTKRECNYDIIELLVSDFKTLAKDLLSPMISPKLLIDLISSRR